MTIAAHPIQRHRSGWAIAVGILMIALGFFAIVIPPIAGIAAAIAVGWLLAIGGVAHLWFAWHMRSSSSFWWELLLGLLYLFVGVWMLARPAASLLSLTLVLAIYLFFRAVLEFVLAFRARGAAGSGWLISHGVFALILALMIWTTWPWSSQWAIGTLVGISVIFAGIARLLFALGARRSVPPLL